MAYEVSKTGYQQIDPTFGPGYPYENKYHNVGQLQTPYIGKKFGKGGDYGPPQATAYYNPWNPNYPYVLDKDFRAAQYLPSQGCCFDHPGYAPCYNAAYPDKYIPENYFVPKRYYPEGHAKPLRGSNIRLHSGTVGAFDSNIIENYGAPVDYRKLRSLRPYAGTKNFFPFTHDGESR